MIEKLGFSITGFLIFCFPAFSSAEEVLVHLMQPPLTADGSPRLSPMLLAIKDSNGVLKGTDENGQAVISVTDDKKASLVASAMVKSIDKVPPEYLPVTRLKISYAKTAKPAASDLESLGLREIEDYTPGSFLIAEPFTKQIDGELASKLAGSPKVRYATPSIRVKAIPPKSETSAKALETPQPPTNDPLWNQLWGMRNIRAPEAWKKIQNSPSVVVAVIDTGLNYKHEDLSKNVWSDATGKHGYDYVQNDNDPMDENGHGTHCAGTLGAVGNNMKGVVGVTWNVQIMGVRWLDRGGRGEVANAIKAIDFAVENGAKILSNSWYWTEDDPDLEAAIKRAGDKDVLFVAAASNWARRPNNNNGDNDKSDTYARYPSAYRLPSIISVTAIDELERIYIDGNWGKTTVHIGAPGVSIMSTVLANDYSASYSGTSMAAAHVSGAAALVLAAYPGSTAVVIKKKILDNARRIPALNERCSTNGTLDIKFLGP